MITTLKSLNPAKLFLSTLRYWRDHFGKLTLLTAIVALPGSLLQTVDLTEFGDLALITSFAGLYLSVALIWVFFHAKDLKTYNIAKLYVVSSQRFLPYLLTSIIITLLVLPVLLGVFIVILAAGGELPMATSAVGIVMSLVVVYFLTRFSLSTFLVVQNQISAFSSLRLSWQITQKKVVATILAWVSIFVVTLLFSTIVFSVTDLVTVIRENALVQSVLSGLLLVVILPVFFGYGVMLTNKIEEL